MVWYIVLGYALVGFMIATAILKFSPGESSDNDTEAAGGFLIIMVLWPIIFGALVLYGPFWALKKYVAFLQR